MRYVICERGGTPLQDKAVYLDGKWWCFPHAEEYAKQCDDWRLAENIFDLLLVKGWKGREYRD